MAACSDGDDGDAAAPAAAARPAPPSTTTGAPATDAPIPEQEAATVSDPPADAPEAVSKGCSVVPEGAGAVSKKTLTTKASLRAYHLAVPAGVETNQALPLVFVLHGAGDTAPEHMREWFAVEANMSRPALMVYPQALPRTRADGSGGHIPRWDLYSDEDLSFFDAMLVSLSEAYCVDRRHVFVTGYSSGGNFSQNLACLRQKDVKGMAVVAGPGPYANGCGGAVPSWMTHDVGDTTLPVNDARSSRDHWAIQNGCATSVASWAPIPGRSECKRNTSCPAGAPLVYCETAGAGHGVPHFAVEAIGGFLDALLK